MGAVPEQERGTAAAGLLHGRQTDRHLSDRKVSLTSSAICRRNNLHSGQGENEDSWSGFRCDTCIFPTLTLYASLSVSPVTN